MHAMQKWIAVTLVFSGVVLINYFNSLWLHTPLPSAIGTVLHNLEEAREHAVYSAALLASPAATEIQVPVVGVPASAVADTFGDPRGTDRTHQGVDIFAPRGTYVVSATEGVVARIGTNRLGGNIVFVLGPGGERYYYAHLDEIDPMLALGTRVGTTTLIGRVGTTGNATGTPPHLHFGIYSAGGTKNPYERLNPGI